MNYDDTPPPSDEDAPMVIDLDEHRPATERPLTDLGNAELFGDQHGRDLRWCSAFGWLVWDGRRWKPDDDLEVPRRAQRTARSRYQEAHRANDPDRRQAIARWAAKSESRSRLEAITDLGRTDQRIACTAESFDRDPWLFACHNVTIDLQGEEPREHRREDMNTKCSPVTYDPEARCPTFDRFLASVFGGDEDLAAFALRWFGSALTGIVRDQTMVIAHGTGANGKSTLLDIVAHVLGDYAVTAPPHLLVARSHEAHPTERTVLRGARLVTSVEIGEGRRWDEELVKQLTGGDPITARQMRQDFYTFDPTHKLTVACNHLPHVRGTDHAIWRRLLVLPFGECFKGERCDPQLPAKLRAEASGILNRLLLGCLEWRRKGLAPPDAVRLASDEYRQAEDVVGMFIEECCVVGPGLEARAGELYGAYRSWCEKQGRRPITGTAFGRDLKDRGFEVSRDRQGQIRHGIGLGRKE